jgi:flavin reductase (DIM6/NTAB) family NADH-FMN oxidoreductase RutF
MEQQAHIDDAESGDAIEMEKGFRSAMRVTAASVSLLTCRSEDNVFQGMAVTSASSLSMAPPSMIVAVNRSASSYETVRDTGMFCLNLLAQEHIGLVDSFCRSENRNSRFQSPSWRRGPHGLPYLDRSLASIFCSVAAVHDYATHAVFFGTVIRTICDPLDERTPLIWLHGGPLPQLAQESA